MMHPYCTLFDSKYLSRGLALYRSLLEVKADFHLYILAMDEQCWRILKDLRLRHATLIKLEDFEDKELLKAKSTRTRQEYCWTCTPSVIRYCLDHFRLHECTYLDADIFFFQNPRILHDEMGKKSVLITKHNYFPAFDQSVASGKYCVQFITFRNDRHGRIALEWWRSACNTWCYARVEDGKFGDQKYLDDWTERFTGIHVLRHPGGGVAPWNIQNFDLEESAQGPIIRPIGGSKKYHIVFYHFHDFYLDEKGSWFHKSGLKDYCIGRDTYALIYTKYLLALFSLGKDLPADASTDLPKMPDEFPAEDFDSRLIPALKTHGDRNVLRECYVLSGNTRSLKPNLSFEKKYKAFVILLKTGYKLDRYALWLQPGNFVYELLREKDISISRLTAKFKRIESSIFYRIIRKAHSLLRAGRS